MQSEHVNRIEDTKFDDFPNSDERRASNSDSDKLSNFPLTIGESSSPMLSERCKFASNRKAQRTCKEGRIDFWKLSTTRNGLPVSEWFVNEISLLNHIEKNEIKWEIDVVISLPATPIGGGNANAVLDGFDNANQKPNENNKPVFAPNALAMPIEGGDTIAHEIGETRSLASLLIEDAKLTAELEGKRELVTEKHDE